MYYATLHPSNLQECCTTAAGLMICMCLSKYSSCRVESLFSIGQTRWAHFWLNLCLYASKCLAQLVSRLWGKLLPWEQPSIFIFLITNKDKPWEIEKGGNMNEIHPLDCATYQLMWWGDMPHSTKPSFLSMLQGLWYLMLSKIREDEVCS